MKQEEAEQLIKCVKECWWRVAILLALISGFTLIAILGWPRYELDQTMAAWVQAIGTLIALGVAIAVPAWQNKKLEERRQKDAQRKLWQTLRLAWTLTSSCMHLARGIHEFRSNCDNSLSPADRSASRDRVDELASEIFKVPLSSIKNGEALDYFMRARRSVLEAQDLLHRDPYPDAVLVCSPALAKPWIKICCELREAGEILGLHVKELQGDHKEPTFSPYN